MKQLFLSLVVLALLASCQMSGNKGLVVLETTRGDIKIKLYDETPEHRDNFLKLAKEGYLDSVLFHRVIKDFMIQGGDPDSKNAEPGQQLGNGGPDYTIPAEIDFPKLFHKKGALAAARTGDNVNPERRSSGSQFYIVQGKTFSDEDLAKVEARVKDMGKQGVFYKLLENYRDTLAVLQQAGNQEAMMALQTEIMEKVEAEAANLPAFEIPEEVKEIYRTLGGVPHLDTNYTVFGEVVEGLEIVDEIAAVQCDPNDRPLEDVRILKVTVN